AHGVHGGAVGRVEVGARVVPGGPQAAGSPVGGGDVGAVDRQHEGVEPSAFGLGAGGTLLGVPFLLGPALGHGPLPLVGGFALGIRLGGKGVGERVRDADRVVEGGVRGPLGLRLGRGGQCGGSERAGGGE